MAIENKGPGNVGNSYGLRLSTKPTLYDQAGKRHQVYDEYTIEKTKSIYRDATGALLASGIPVSSGGNFSDGQLVCDWSSTLGVLTGTTLPTGATVALDPTTLSDGIPALKLTMGTGTGAMFVDYVFNTPITMAQLVSLQIPIKLSSNVGVFSGTNGIEIEFSDTVNPGAAVRRWRAQTALRGSKLRSGVWHTLSLAPGATSEGWTFAGSSTPTSTTDMDAQTIARIRITITVPGGVNGQAAWLGSIKANARRASVLTILLHGNYDSQHKYILPILEAQGLRAVLAISVSTIGNAGRMTQSQLDRAYAAGHDIVLRCFNDSIFGNGYSDTVNFPTQRSVVDDLLAGRAYMVSKGYTRGLDYLNHGGSVHPYAGTVTQARQDVLTGAFTDAGIIAATSGDHNEPGVLNRCQSMARISNVDRLDLLGALQWANTTTSADLIAVATRAKARGEWGLITGHESVVSAPAGLQILNSDLFTAAQSWGDDVRSGKLLNLTLTEGCKLYGLV